MRFPVTYIALILLFSFCFFGCNDSPKNNISSPMLSAADEWESSGVKAYEKIDFNAPGDLISNPNNFREFTPVKWDGKSKLESGVHYWYRTKDLEKLAAIDPRHKDVFASYLEMKKNGAAAATTKNKTDNTTRVASTMTSANAQCGGVFYADAFATASGVYGYMSCYCDCDEIWISDHRTLSGRLDHLYLMASVGQGPCYGTARVVESGYIIDGTTESCW